MVPGGSVGLNHPELMSSFTAGLDPCVVLWFKQVSEELNHPELMRNYPMILVSSGAQWFEEVR